MSSGSEAKFMARTIRVVSVGPAMCVPGGMSRVMELISTHLPSHIGYKAISTFTKYTGYNDAEGKAPGRILGQAFVFFWAFVQVLILALGRRTVFHVHVSGGGSILRKGIICVLLRSLRCQYVVHNHQAGDTLFHEWVPLFCQRILLWGLSGAGRMIVLSHFWRDYYSSLLDLPLNRMVLLPNPADLPESIPDRSKREGLNLIFLGRIGVRKGAFDIIRALAALPEDLRSRCRLTMAGDGDTNEARALAEELGCSDRVSITGWIAKADVQQLLVESDVLMLPSYAEGMAMALIEGMSWGLPVVTTGVGGASEFLEQGRNCILVTPGDVPGISDAISELAGNPAFRHHMGCAARETISRFSLDNYIVTLNEVYEELARRLPTNQSAVVPAPQA
jgi:glycosyltransferase involved in cell wall biosynthesis